MLKTLAVILVLALLVLAGRVASPEFGIYITEAPKVSLEQALPAAVKAAQASVPDLDKFVLHSVKPRVFKNDKEGMHWEFLWQELQFKTHMRGVIVRVYMKDGATVVTQFQE
jgi:hypothetical protein